MVGMVEVFEINSEERTTDLTKYTLTMPFIYFQTMVFDQHNLQRTMTEQERCAVANRSTLILLRFNNLVAVLFGN